MVPSALMPKRIVDGFGSDVLPHPYQQEPSPTPLRITEPLAFALNALASAFALAQWV